VQPMLLSGLAATASATFVRMVNPFDRDAIVATARFQTCGAQARGAAFIR
jgi:hypothetical protein